MRQALERLCTCTAPSGFEAPAAAVAAELLRPLVDEVSIDRMGNVLGVRRSKTPNAPKLLLVRDSYSDCLTPFLTQNFSEIHLFDLRNNNMSLSAYVEENQIDQVLVLYSTANFTTDGNLFKMGI